MKRIATGIFFLILSCSFVYGQKQSSSQKSAQLPKNLESYLKKYPYPSDFIKSVPGLKSRLRALLGKNYDLFDSNITLQTPIEKEGNLLIASGAFKYQQGFEESIYIIDLTTRKIHIGVISQEFKGEYKVFSEDPTNVPEQLREWIDTRAERK